MLHQRGANVSPGAFRFAFLDAPGSLVNGISQPVKLSFRFVRIRRRMEGTECCDRPLLRSDDGPSIGSPGPRLDSFTSPRTSWHGSPATTGSPGRISS